MVVDMKRTLWLAWVLLLLSLSTARSGIPDNNINYAVLLEFENGCQASGFVLMAEDRLFLITARHVLRDASGHLRGNILFLTTREPNGPKTTFSRIRVNLADLEASGQVLFSASHDAAATAIGRVQGIGERRQVNYVPQVKLVSGRGITALDLRNTVSSEALRVTAEVYVSGYPNSLGVDGRRPWNAQIPLVRRGCIAGLNAESRLIILDCRVDRGNSGGPVILQTASATGDILYRVIGLVSEWVPQADQWVNPGLNQVNLEVSNSGYSTVVPMEVVYELVAASVAVPMVNR